MENQSDSNRFTRGAVKAKRTEKIAFGFFCVITYFILACAGYIFGDIIFKGGAFLFKFEFPFINTKFLTQAPQTLHVFEDSKIEAELRSVDYNLNRFRNEIRMARRAGQPFEDKEAKVAELETESRKLRQQLLEARLQYSDRELRDVNGILDLIIHLPEEMTAELEEQVQTFVQRVENDLPERREAVSLNELFTIQSRHPEIASFYNEALDGPVGPYLRFMEHFQDLPARYHGDELGPINEYINQANQIAKEIDLENTEQLGRALVRFNGITTESIRTQAVELREELDGDTRSHASYAYSGGGIFPCIVGTVLLVVGSMTIALVLGILSAIYLSEYSRDTPFIRLIRLSILNLAGVPSIVFGLFGMALFVKVFGWNVSLIAGWFTLAFMVLPIVITASEEALRAVPQGFREGSLALGATKWQSIRSNVLPYALPGILTSSVLGIARVAGETAPIMFTAAYASRDKLPWEVSEFSDFFFQGVMALPYHIYVVSSKIPANEFTKNMQYGTAFVFLLIVILIALASIILRVKAREKYKW